jgi:Uma2 family endonuclease
MASPAEDLLQAALEAADEAMIKLEMVGGVPVWEAMPGPKHQRLVVAILNSVSRQAGHTGDWECHTLTDVTVRFPDGSFKRPDVAVFCRQPDEEQSSVDLVPEAVVEVLSKGYEAKDLQIGLPFYLAQGVKDVVLYDPSNLAVLHVRPTSSDRLTAPATLNLACGCTVTIPL